MELKCYHWRFVASSRQEVRCQREDIKEFDIVGSEQRVGYVTQKSNPGDFIDHGVWRASSRSSAEIFKTGLKIVCQSENTMVSTNFVSGNFCMPMVQKKRVTIFDLVLGPEVLVLDERAAGQDPTSYTRKYGFHDGLPARDLPLSWLHHIMQLMLDYSDRAVVVMDGQVWFDTGRALDPTRNLQRQRLVWKKRLAPPWQIDLVSITALTVLYEWRGKVMNNP